MTGSIAVSQCGHTPNRPGHHGTVVARTVGTVAISCNEAGDFVPTLVRNQSDAYPTAFVTAISYPK